MDMSNIAKWIPVPYFQIRQDGTILNSSNITHSYFQSTSSIWNIIYKEDRNKAILMLSQITNSYPVTQQLIYEFQMYDPMAGQYRSSSMHRSQKYQSSLCFICSKIFSKYSKTFRRIRKAFKQRY